MHETEVVCVVLSLDTDSPLHETEVCGVLLLFCPAKLPSDKLLQCVEQQRHVVARQKSCIDAHSASPLQAQ